MLTKASNKFALHIIVITTIFTALPIQALSFKIDKNTDIVGELKYIVTKKGDNLHTIAQTYDLGLLEMIEANPKVNPDKIKPGTKLIIPTEFILPPGERQGLVINLAELRVYYFLPDGKSVVTYPLGIGKQGWHTPIGETTIVAKREHPTWTPPPAIRQEAEERGIELPDVVPAGPHNPLGAYAMSLGWNGYQMHGTNAPQSVGLRSSHGCMRMYADDIKGLFELVSIGTKVRSIYEPYKLGVKNKNLFLEAHELFPDNYYKIRHADKYSLLQEVVKSIRLPNIIKVNWDTAKMLINETYGYPVNISDAIEHVN